MVWENESKSRTGGFTRYGLGKQTETESRKYVGCKSDKINNEKSIQ